jgi:hypothetical protein
VKSGTFDWSRRIVGLYATESPTITNIHRDATEISYTTLDLRDIDLEQAGLAFMKDVETSNNCRQILHAICPVRILDVENSCIRVSKDPVRILFPIPLTTRHIELFFIMSLVYTLPCSTAFLCWMKPRRVSISNTGQTFLMNSARFPKNTRWIVSSASF